MSQTLISLMPAAAVAVFLGGAAIAARRPLDKAPGVAMAASTIAFLLALIGAAGTAAFGPAQSPLLGAGGIGLMFRLDGLSATLFLLVAFVGLVVTRYSKAYLAGDPRQPLFLARLAMTLAAVTALVTSGHLVQLVLAWIATSAALHTLLLYRPERPRAVVAARKKLVAARAGDLFLIAAAVLIAGAFGTAEIGEIAARARAAETGGAGLQLAAFFLALAALLKSAQFPTHGWLTEVMETPTPVSALLHAGIINAGGFLVIRFADVMMLSAGSMHLLALLGGFTALFGSVVMLTQTSIKVSLAWSTVAQMGFMLLQCGLGAYSAAVLHIVAHSLYKAHAFLSSGGVVGTVPPSRPARLSAPALLGSFAAALGIFLFAYLLFAGAKGTAPAIVTLGAVFVMGLFVLTARGATGRDVFVRVLPIAGAMSVLYFAFQWAAASILTPALPAPPAPGAFGIVIMGLVLVSFALIAWLQVAPRARQGRLGRRLYVHLSNGLYANAVFGRLVGGMSARGGAARTTLPSSPDNLGAAQ